MVYDGKAETSSSHPDAANIARVSGELRSKMIVLEAELALMDQGDAAAVAEVRDQLAQVRKVLAMIDTMG